MIFRHIQPSPHLRPYIKVYMLLHFRFNANNPAPVKPFPANPNQGITFYPRGGLMAYDPSNDTLTKRARTVIFGQQVSRLNLHLTQDDYMMFDVSFQPGILAKFIRLPLREFVNQNVDAEAVLSREVYQLNDRLANADNYEQMIELVEEYLWNRIQWLNISLDPIDKISRLVVANAQPLSLDQWANEACLSVSAFERRFSQQLGVSPKLFARIIRFDQVMKLREQNPQFDWLSIALRAGYTDYQHLVKDFKQFAAATPVILIGEEANAPERWLGLV